MNKITFEKKKEKNIDTPFDIKDLINLIISSEKMEESSKISIRGESYPFEIPPLKNFTQSGKKISALRTISMKIYLSDEMFDIPGFSSYLQKTKSELLKVLNALQLYFDDLEERHIQYFRFKEKLKEMKEIVDQKYWDLSRLIIGCIDATTNTEAEDLTISQLRAFQKVIKEITKDIDCSKANSLLKMLISENLKPVPDLKNFEPIEI